MTTGLIDIMKRAAVDANDASQPCDLRYGTITEVNPLKVQISPQFIIPESMLIIPKHLTDFKVPVSFNWSTISADNHLHQISSNSGEKTMTVHNGLRIGDYVTLIRQKGGKKYFIVGILVSGYNGSNSGGNNGGNSGDGTVTPDVTPSIKPDELEQLIRNTLQEMIDSGEFDGKDGKDGEDGKSAYEIWLEQGNTGSEQDFLSSLKGDPFVYEDFTDEQLEDLRGKVGGGGNVSINLNGTEETGEVMPINADTLGGLPAEDYAPKQYVDNSVKDTIYKANLSASAIFANSQPITQLTLPAGNYLVCVTSSGATSWLTYGNSTIPSTSDYKYAKIADGSSMVKLLEFTSQTTLYLYNFTGTNKEYCSATSIVAVRVK